MEYIINHIFKRGQNNVRHASLFSSFFILSSVIVFPLIFSTKVLAYSASLNTSASIVLNTDPNHATVHTESINVVSDCQAGYNLTISTSGNNKLYKNGDSSITTGVFNPVNISYALNDKTNNSNTWGYSLINEPGTIGAFNPITATPAFLRTVDQTATEDPTIDDTFNLYYGVNIAPDTPAGSYRMADNGTIVYQLTMAESCNENLEIIFLANTDSDPVSNLPTNADNTIDPATHSLILSTKSPARSGYIFREWNTKADGSGQQFQPGDSIIMGAGGMSGLVDLYAIWVEECASTTVCYDGNGADNGTMPTQAGSANTTLALLPSNFSRSGYGFTGWNTMPDGSGTQYGPNANLKMPLTGGVNLFAQWLKPTGTLQAWANPSGLNVGDVIALKDSRDNEVYTVAKLADNNVWITENLRLVPNTATITAHDTNNPTQDFLDNYKSSSASGMCSDDNATCNNSIQYNTNNINRELTPGYNTNDDASSWYSYGVNYNWYTATAGNGLFSKSNGSVDGDLCPAGWHLPTGGSGGEWGTLASALSATNDTKLREYPVNIIRSGDYNPSEGGGTGRGKQGRIWTATASSGTNAYRMGYSASEVSSTKNWNKWDGFNIRCIYQGGNIPFVNINVVFSGDGISSVTFTNPNYGTETATASDPTVNLAENAPYTITAITDDGYELTSWVTTSTGVLDSTTDNPTTYTITDESTLTVTGAIIPSYTTTVTFPEHVTSVTFSHPEHPTQTVTTSGDIVTLKKNIPYTITATYEEGYTLDWWITSTGGSFGDETASTTTYTVTSDTTLSLNIKEAELLTYTLHYDASSGVGAPADDTKTSYHNPYIFTIDASSSPFLYGSHFIGYSETQGSTTATYVYDSTNHTFTPNTISVTSTDSATTKTLYAVYQEDTCPANRICYFGNGAEAGSMNNQNVSDTTINLIPPNYSRTGYGFAGWIANSGDPSQNIPETIYGPGETITPGDLSSSGLKLYAKWIASVGNFQSWNGCNSLSQGSVTALTDTRDNQTYAVAKLADDNCWIIENLRLDPATANISAINTHNPTPTFVTAVTAAGGQSLSTNTMCNTNDKTCFDQIQYNANSLNLNRSLTPSYTTESDSVYWYSYGVYYNWYTATAGNGTYETTETSGVNSNGVVDGDLCPINWHLPTGGANGEYKLLNDAINNGATGADTNWRAYPNNFIRSGDFNNTKRTKGNVNGRVWTATAKDNNSTYRVGFDKSSITPSANTYYKWDGFIMRCVRDEGTIEYSDVTVTLPTGVDSITFTSTKYGEQTATLTSPTISIVQEATYTITANESVGYEFSSWTAGQGATLGDVNANPTTLIITGDTTLAVTAQTRPSYQVNVTIDQGVTSLGIYDAQYGSQTFTPATMTDNYDGTYSATATLYDKIKYTITGAFDTENYYIIDNWATTENGILESTIDKTTNYTITGNTSLTLVSKQRSGATTLLPGKELNAKMKTLAEGIDTSYSSESSKIKAIYMTDSLPVDFNPYPGNTVSEEDSEKPIYIFFDNTDNAGIMYFYTEAREVYMNNNSNYAFSKNINLANIEALTNWDTSNVTNMSNMFYYVKALTSIDGAINWDTSNVRDMSGMFWFASSLTNIDGAINWDTSNVTNMSRMFDSARALTNIDGAINWDTSNVTYMSEMFDSARALTNIDGAINWDTSNVTNMSRIFEWTETLTNIDGAINWDTSNVTNMSEMFYYAKALTNIDGAINWDASNVTNMSGMFRSASALTNIDGAINWDTSNVTYMSEMFDSASALTNIDGAINWDTSNVTNMSEMFRSASALTNIDGAIDWDTSNVRDMRNMFRSATYVDGSLLNDWDISGVKATAGESSYNENNFFCIFGYGPGAPSTPCDSANTAHPIFINRSGTWNNEGTFIPNDTTPGSSLPAPTVVINFDSHIQNIKVGGKTVSTSGGTVSLSRGENYTITATFAPGYELAIWDSGEHGVIPPSRLTLNSRANDYTSFIPTGDTTLTATSQPIPGDVTTTVNIDQNISKVSFCNKKYNTYNASTEKYDCMIASSNGSTVTLKQGISYRVIVATKSGYEVTSYTVDSGSITNTTGPHTDFTPSGNSSLTVASTTKTPTHMVTVNMDDNISYISFTNNDWPSKTAINTNNTVELRANTPYTITAYTKKGYKLSTWSTTINGTLDSIVTNPTAYSITGDTTLTATSGIIPTHQVSVNMDVNVDSVSFYNAVYGVQTANQSNPIVSLREGVEYIITGNYTAGHDFSSWATGANGTLGDTTSATTTYMVTDTTTLSITSR